MIISALNLAFNKYLSADPNAAKKLDSIAGKVIVLRVKELGKDLYIIPHSGNIEVVTTCSVIPTTIIEADLFGLLQLVRPKNLPKILRGGRVTIEGDVEVATVFRTALSEVDIDWEELASHYVGDIFAYQMGKVFRNARNYRQNSLSNIQMDIREYLQEELCLVPTRLEVNDFLSEIDILRADIDRLEARVSRAEHTRD